MEDIRKCPWIQIFEPAIQPHPQCRLFLFPHAGGNPVSYRGWIDSLPKGVQLCALLYPARGRRFAEDPINDMGVLVKQLVEGIAPFLTDAPYFFVGHSLGARVAYEAARYMQQQRPTLPLPQHLFLSACPPILSGSDVKTNQAQVSALSDSEFIEYLRGLGGTPDEMQNNAEMMEFLMPSLRADYELLESHEASMQKSPGTLFRGVGATAMGGKGDPLISEGMLQQWKQWIVLGSESDAEKKSSASAGKSEALTFTVRMFPGSHFYLLQEKDAIQFIDTVLQSRLESSPL